jgi:hypothetical protein
MYILIDAFLKENGLEFDVFGEMKRMTLDSASIIAISNCCASSTDFALFLKVPRFQLVFTMGKQG